MQFSTGKWTYSIWATCIYLIGEMQFSTGKWTYSIWYIGLGTLERVWTVLKHKQPSASLHPWSWPKQPWSRMHLDFAGPLFNHMYLVMVDAHTKWILCPTWHHLAPFNNLEHSSLSLVFIGLAVFLDNVPSFTSAEFQDFMYKNGKRHIHSSPYHAQSNGLAGCAADVFKGLKQKMKLQFLTR